MYFSADSLPARFDSLRLLSNDVLELGAPPDKRPSSHHHWHHREKCERHIAHEASIRVDTREDGEPLTPAHPPHHKGAQGRIPRGCCGVAFCHNLQRRCIGAIMPM